MESLFNNGGVIGKRTVYLIDEISNGVGEYLLIQARNEGIKVFQTSTSGLFTSSDLQFTTSYGGDGNDGPNGKGSGIEVSADGTKVYYWTGGTVNQLSMSTPFDFDNATPETTFQAHPAGENDNSYGTAATFFDSGTKAYVSWGQWQDGRMDLWSFSTPYDWSTATFVRQDSVNPQGHCGNIEFNSDGTRAYHGDRGGYSGVYQIELNTPFDLSSQGSISQISTQGDVLGVRFSPDGQYCYTSHHSPDITLRHYCGTPFDFTTSTEEEQLLGDQAYNGAFVTGPSYY